MKLISVDGSQGAGKTSLCHLLARFFDSSLAIPLDPTGHDKDKNPELYDFLSIYAECINDTRTYFENGKAVESDISDTMFLLYTARLRMIQSFKFFHDFDYIFVDSFFDPCWRFEEEMTKQTLETLKRLVRLPDIAFFLSWDARRAYLRRCAASDVEEIYSQEEYDRIDKKRRFFIKYAQRKRVNLHKLQASKPQSDVLDEAIRVIVEKYK